MAACSLETRSARCLLLDESIFHVCFMCNIASKKVRADKTCVLVVHGPHQNQTDKKHMLLLSTLRAQLLKCLQPVVLHPQQLFGGERRLVLR